MKKTIGVLLVLFGLVLTLTAFFITLGVPMIVVGAILFFWPSTPKHAPSAGNAKKGP